MQLLSWAIGATLVVHGGLAAFVATLPREADAPPPTVITVREVTREAPPPPPPPPPAVAAAPVPAAAPPKPKPAAPKVKPAAPPPPTSAPAAAPAPTNLGLTMSNSGGGDGPAVAAPAEAPAPKAEAPVAKTLAAAPAASGCSDPIVKPTPISVVQPAFTQDAKDAGITGKVRVEITISATGDVTNARVIAGLGYGLDEAALEAARAATFSPATQCGEPVATTFTIGMRFQ